MESKGSKTWSAPAPSTPATGKKPRRPVTNVRRENVTNKMTKIGKSEIHYSDDTIIGHGASSIVYSGFYKDPVKKAAVKRVFNDIVELFKSEIDIWLQVTACAVTKANVNIVQLYHWTSFEEAGKTSYYFAMEMANGDLQKELERMNSDSDPAWRAKSLGYLEDAANGLSWLHSKRVIHRDIKPENILIFSGDDNGGGRNIAKLGDFGISRKISEGTKSGTDSMARGTLNWMSPEAVQANMKGTTIYSTKALDIFSFGVTGHYVMTNGQRHPFDTSGRFIFMNISDPEAKPSTIGDGEFEADHLFQWAMSKEPRERPNIGQVLHHPFFWCNKMRLEFILDVAKSLDNSKDKAVVTLKKDMDASYLKLNPNFNWKERLGPVPMKLLFQRKSDGEIIQCHTHKFNRSSVATLVKLIRDKDFHRADLVDALITEPYFGRKDENGKLDYCEEKLASYFCSQFTDLVIFLLVFLVKNRNSKVVGSLKWKYGLTKYSDSIPDSLSYMDTNNLP